MPHLRSVGTLVGWMAAVVFAAVLVLPPAYAHASLQLSCTDIIVNGGFETQAVWSLSSSAVPPQYVPSPVQAGARAMRLGNLGQLPNLESFSSIKQTVTVPGNAASASLSFWVWTQSQPNPGGDRQELILLPPGATALSQPVQPLWSELSNVPAWRQFQFAINNQIGNTVEIYFNVYNDGLGGSTGMVVDTVVLTVCQGTPSPPPATPTPTSWPGPVIAWVGNLNPNGSNPQTLPAPASLSITVEVNAPPATGGTGQGLGVTCGLQYATVQYFGGPWLNPINVFMVYIGDAGPSDRYAVTIGPLAAGLYQYNAWCSTDGGVTKLWATPNNPGRLTVTGGPPATPTAGPTPGTPWPTAIPPNCQPIIVNGGFEWDGAWLLGPTSLMPFYAGPPNPVHSGARSMALGAIAPNQPSVASYSSAQQIITIPAFAQTALLRFWYYPSSNAAAGGLSRQEAILLDPQQFGETVGVLWRVTENTNAWGFKEIDLTPYRGRTVAVYFNARNAGDGTRTSMFLDDVEVLACGNFAARPEPLPAAMPNVPPGTSPQIIPITTVPLAQWYPTAGPPSSEGASPSPQGTVLAASPQLTAAVGPTPVPADNWKDVPRGARESSSGTLIAGLTPLAALIVVALIVLAAILIGVWLATPKPPASKLS